MPSIRALIPVSQNSCIDTHSIDLPDGWTGQAAAFWQDPNDPAAANPTPIPKQQWLDLLHAVVVQANHFPGAVVLKCSESVVVFRITADIADRPRTLVCKRSRLLGIASWMGRWRSSRARQNWNKAIALLRMGIATAPPLARLERAQPAPESWLVTAFLDNALDLERAISNLSRISEPAQRTTARRRLIAAAASLCQRLDQGHWVHRDLKSSNILVTNHQAADHDPQLWIVDLDGLRGAGPLHAPYQTVTRLAASLSHAADLSGTDRLRFLRAYFDDPDRFAKNWKSTAKRILRDADRHESRSRRGRRGKIESFQ